MKMTVLRVDGQIVTGQLKDGHILDIDKRWLDEEIKEGDVVDVDVEKKKATIKKN